MTKKSSETKRLLLEIHVIWHFKNTTEISEFSEFGSSLFSLQNLCIFDNLSSTRPTAAALSRCRATRKESTGPESSQTYSLPEGGVEPDPEESILLVRGDSDANVKHTTSQRQSVLNLGFIRRYVSPFCFVLLTHHATPRHRPSSFLLTGHIF